ncbi:hypothetical protein Goe24_01220 [Bacillus phage vB_BsuM-Goe24]|nr:hypothetical protein BSP14_112 [Bacillus phage BSP14]QDP43147.1 hypothetical protein Goe7_c01220 [Bacillus phage vB_BveM-Goe7]WCS69239.1 hypothetical protein Goe20_01220 [Bacillus phage vB_BsuM-Goe20]WCS69497.1 hypothetical protein Goe24_01220 [Bacillus phage vB_BsuM-Goe24]
MSEKQYEQDGKVEVTQVQAQAIEEGKRYYIRRVYENRKLVESLYGEFDPDKRAIRMFSVDHFLLLNAGGVVPCQELFEPLYDLSTRELKLALTYGYTVKRAAE